MRRILTAPGSTRHPASPRSELALERRETPARHRVIGMPFEPSFEHLDSRLALTLKPQRVGQAFVRDVFLGKLLTIAPGHRERVVPTVATIEPPADTVEKRWVDTLGLGSTQPTIELAEGLCSAKSRSRVDSTRWTLFFARSKVGRLVNSSTEFADRVAPTKSAGRTCRVREA